VGARPVCSYAGPEGRLGEGQRAAGELRRPDASDAEATFFMLLAGCEGKVSMTTWRKPHRPHSLIRAKRPGLSWQRLTSLHAR